MVSGDDLFGVDCGLYVEVFSVLDDFPSGCPFLRELDHRTKDHMTYPCVFSTSFWAFRVAAVFIEDIVTDALLAVC